MFSGNSSHGDLFSFKQGDASSSANENDTGDNIGNNSGNNGGGDDGSSSGNGGGGGGKLPSNVQPISIVKEMQTAYLDYAMSVIVRRAIPDARDGLKPVHRRIIYAMNESGAHRNKPYRKSARIVGDVMGKYHPHGDGAIYDSLVRMAQPFSLRSPLIDGQGNFGSMDGDNPAAMRYTESRMAKIAHFLTEDIDKDTVDFRDNYDGSEQEPVVLPARFPNLLVNGSGGIAVGMATNIPTHNLGEVIDATLLLAENPQASIDDIIEIVPAPDFPTGAIIVGRSGSVAAFRTGRGSVVMRGRCEIKDIKGGRQSIIVSEVPYQVNKANMVAKIADLVKEKKIEGISDLRDESDKSGVRVVIELKKGTNADVLLNRLYKFTPLQTSFGVNMLALDKGRPRLMNIKEVLQSFIDFREEVITRRTGFLLGKARNRAHIAIGLFIAVANIDEVISIIRTSPDTGTAKKRLMQENFNASEVAPLIELVDDRANIIYQGKCQLTEVQARAILEMKLAKLTGLEQKKLQEELSELAEEIKGYLAILSDKSKLYAILKDELKQVKEQFATPRRTSIEQGEFEEDIESLIPKEDMVVTVTMGGYIKRVPLNSYKAQKRGGKGRSGVNMHDEDVVTELFVADTHTSLLFFSSFGKVYKLKTYKLPLGSLTSRGRSLNNLLPLEVEEKINTVLAVDNDDDESLNIIFATSNGTIRRNSILDFKSVYAAGKIAIKLEEDNKLIGVALASNESHIMLATKLGKCIRFDIDAIRVFKSRASAGVRGVNLEGGDKVISLTILRDAEKNMEFRDKYLKIPVQKRIELGNLVMQSEELAKESLEGNIEDIELLAKIAKLTKKLLTMAEMKEGDADSLQKWCIEEEFLLTLTENGFGKRTSAFEYRITNRGGKGIINIIRSERNGNVVSSITATDMEELMLVTDKGKMIRCPVHDIRVTGRNTQGVTVFKVAKGEKIISVAKVEEREGEKED